ncbi:MAG: hypothetical protein L0H64_02280 [Pseudonocardia sp.]|nr:hypothetical protein [Pseudonocardia sp.]
MGVSSRGRRDDVGHRTRPGDPPAQPEAAAGGGRHHVDVLQHPEHLAGRGEDGSVAHPAVEHVEQHLAPEPVACRGPGGRGHRHGQRRGGVGAVGDSGPQVAVGEDADAPVVEGHHHRRRAARRHPLCGVPDGGRRRRRAQQLGHRALRGVRPPVRAARDGAAQPTRDP